MYTFGPIAIGSSSQVVLDDVWKDVTFDFTLANWSDATFRWTASGSVDEGANWFTISGPNSNGAGPAFSLNAPINAVKIAVTAGAVGNTLTIRFTGK